LASFSCATCRSRARPGARRLVRHRLSDDRDPAPDDGWVAADRHRRVEREAGCRAQEGRRDGAARRQGRLLRTESALPRLSFADDVYDLVVCNLGLARCQHRGRAARLREGHQAGGEVRCTLPLAGTFEEFHDLYRECWSSMIATMRSSGCATTSPAIPAASRSSARWARRAGRPARDRGVRAAVPQLARVLLRAVIEYGPLSEWKAVAGGGQHMQDVFCTSRRRSTPTSPAAVPAHRQGRLPDRQETGARGRGRADDPDAEGSDGSITTPFELVSTFDTEATHRSTMSIPDVRGLRRHGRWLGAVPLDALAEAAAPPDAAIDEDSAAEQELDAFIDGRKRRTTWSISGPGRWAIPRAGCTRRGRAGSRGARGVCSVAMASDRAPSTSRSSTS